MLPAPAACWVSAAGSSVVRYAPGVLAAAAAQAGALWPGNASAGVLDWLQHVRAEPTEAVKQAKQCPKVYSSHACVALTLHLAACLTRRVCGFTVPQVSEQLKKPRNTSSSMLPVHASTFCTRLPLLSQLLFLIKI